MQLNKLAPVFDMSSSQCSRQMRFLICSTLFPLCTDEVQKPVRACRNDCEKVKNECSHDPIVKQYWPDILDCEQLPHNGKSELCLNVSNLKKIKICREINMNFNLFLDATRIDS